MIWVLILLYSQCSQQNREGLPSLARSYRWLLSTLWAKELTSGLQLRPGYVPSQAEAPTKTSSADFCSNALVTPIQVLPAQSRAALHVHRAFAMCTIYLLVPWLMLKHCLLIVKLQRGRLHWSSCCLQESGTRRCIVNYFSIELAMSMSLFFARVDGFVVHQN